MTSLTAAFSFIVALSGAIKGWPAIDPYMPAQKYWVSEQVNQIDKNLKPVINQLLLGDYQRELRRLERDQLEADKEKAQWNIKFPTETDPLTKSMIEKRLMQIDQDKQKMKVEELKVKEQINKLKVQ